MYIERLVQREFSAEVPVRNESNEPKYSHEKVGRRTGGNPSAFQSSR